MTATNWELTLKEKSEYGSITVEINEANRYSEKFKKPILATFDLE